MPVEVHQPSNLFLRSMVNHILFMDTSTDESPEEWMRLFPNATTNMCFTLDHDLVTMEYGVMRNNASTSCIRPVTFNLAHKIRMMTVQFKPFAFHLFTGSPMKSFMNEFPGHDTFFPASRLERLYDSLHEASSNTCRVLLLENFLLECWRLRQADQRMEYLTKLVTDIPAIDMEELAHKVNLSTRGLRDLFVRHIGISPKYFSKLMRFNRSAGAIAEDSDSSLTTIACNAGYYDQAHFIRDFREFGGITPGEFQQIRAKTADFYNFRATNSPTFTAAY